ncbi:MAG: VWA domain-containing protein [Cocleimonas sp.]|nr:VWA domain-containing protein [Cocleimonas sp.]
MLEEIVGSSWHRFISQRAMSHYPDAQVKLEDVRYSMGVFFRALGGEGGLRVESATDSKHYARRSILQRIAGSGNKVQYAWRDDETLRLPESIALFPTQTLNRDLYLWLTALSVVSLSNSEAKDWISRNQYRTRKTLALWPGLTSRYQCLLSAHLEQRPDPKTLSKREADQEDAICAALKDDHQSISLEYAKHPPQPVLLWLHPAPPSVEFNGTKTANDPDHSASSNEKNPPTTKQQKRKQGKREEMPQGNDGLMSFRLESLWSWAEYTKVDRTTHEDDEDDAMMTAEDLDNISVSQNSETTAGKIKLDLDLPSSQYDDLILGEGIAVDEWDFKSQRLQKNHCRLQMMQSKESDAMELPQRLVTPARKLRRQFEIIRPQRHWVSRQSDGTAIDLENYINFLTDQKRGTVNSDMPVYRALQNQTRDLSCLLLADLSLSTDAHINNTARVIDVIRDALFLFSEALSVSGDRFALHGFSSRNRNHIRFYTIKSFDQAYNNEVRGYINAVRPGYYTRMGAAIRYASKLLIQQASSQNLLLILTDGKPNDLDKYEGRYGIEDTRMAVLEAERMGLRPFCVTIDEQAENYLPYLFGQRSYLLIRDAKELPRKLPLLYLRLTQH